MGKVGWHQDQNQDQKKMRHNNLVCLALWTLLFAAIGCGGGGHHDDTPESIGDLTLPSTLFDPTVFNGIYSISYTLVTKTCRNSSPLAVLSETYTVTSGTGFRGLPVNNVTADNGLGFVGYSTDSNTDGVSFFTAAEDGGPHNLPNFVAGYACNETISLRFQNSGTDGNRSTQATRTSNISCVFPNDDTFDFSCQVVYEGTGPID